MNKRHAKPTAAALADRTYRKQLWQERSIKTLSGNLAAWELKLARQYETLCSGQAMLSQRMESLQTIVDHCVRLLREKETLQRQLAEANKYMARPAPTLPDHDVVRRDFGEDTPCGKCGYYHYGRCPT